MVVRDYSKIQTVFFDLDGTLLTGLGPYESSLEQAVKDVFGINIQVGLSSFHGLTDREILYRTLQQTGSLKLPARNQNPKFEQKINECLKRFGEIYQADATQTQLLPNVKETLYSMNIEGGPSAHTAIVTGNTEEMARKKLALFNRDNEDKNEELRYQGLNLYLSSGAFGNQSYYRENLVSLAIQNIERERIEREVSMFTSEYYYKKNVYVDNHEERKERGRDKLFLKKREIEAKPRKNLLDRLRLKIIRGLYSDEELDPLSRDLFEGLKREDFQIPSADIYVVGDTAHDIFAGLKSRDFYSGKILTVGVLTGRGTREQLQEAGADYIIEDILELREIIPNQAIEYNVC